MFNKIKKALVQKLLFDFGIPLYVFKEYRGVCHDCGASQDIDNLWVTKIMELEDRIYFWPIFPYFCPGCTNVLRVIQKYKSLDITEELKTMVHHENQ